MSIAVKINDTEVRVRLDQISRGIRPQSVFRIAREVMKSSIAETFLEEGFPGGSWKRQRLSSLATAFERGGKNQAFKKRQPRPGTQVKTAGFRRFIAGNKILTNSGRLQKSISYQASGRQLNIGTNLIYAAIHQFGGVIRPKNKKFLAIPLPGGGVIFRKKVTIPARPFLLIKPDDPAEISTALEDFLGDKK